jgi:hypothetical protein
MAPQIKDLGTWTLYTPDPMPDWVADIPTQYKAYFAKRDSDGVDWYQFRTDPAAFTPGFLLALIAPDSFSSNGIVQGVYRGVVNTPGPGGFRLIEIEDLDPDDPVPHKLYEQRVFDPATLTIGDPWKPPIIAVSDYQFAGQANAEGIITDKETDDWVGSGIVPESLVEAVKKAVTDPERQRRVILFLKGTKAFPQFHELTPLLAAIFKKDTPEKLAAFFLAASKR